MKGELKRYIKTSENDDMTYQNFWDVAKTEIRGKFVSLQAYLKKQEKPQVNHLTSHLKELEKEEQKQPKFSRRKEIIKIRAELNKIENKRTIQKINTTKSWFFEKTNKIALIGVAQLLGHQPTKRKVTSSIAD